MNSTQPNLSGFRKKKTSQILKPALAGVFALLLLAGCTGQRDPGNYGDGVRDEFIKGCIGDILDPGVSKDSDRAPSTASRDECAYVYEQIEKKVDFDDFRSANTKLREGSIDKLPKDIQKVVDDAHKKFQQENS